MPGEAYLNGKIFKTDVGQDVAWKNGIFDFTDEEIESIMRKISRWYNVDIFYSGSIPQDLFSGIINRDNNLEQVLHILESTRKSQI